MLPSCSVVICAHTLDRLEHTQAAVRSVLRGSVLPDELFLIVDSNSELLKRLERAFDDTRVRVVASAGSGASAARNTALALSNTEICAFLDDDAEADTEWLAELLQPFAEPSVCGAGGFISPHWEIEGSRPLAEELLWIVGSTYKGHPEAATEISRPIGANMAVRTTIALEVGGFPAAFGPVGGKKSSSNEELALFSTIRRSVADAKVVFVPTARVRHFAPRNRTTWKYIWTRSWAEGRSKLQARRAFGGEAMAYDSDYAKSILLPGMARYIAMAIQKRQAVYLKRCAQCVLSLTGAAGGYITAMAWSLAQHSSGEPTVPSNEKGDPPGGH